MTPLAERVDFSDIRYGQVWEDADVLLEGLDVQPGDVCVSVASAGDNTLALLTRRPARVVAVDFSPAQIACLELRVAAYRTLSHPELLELMGSRPSQRREVLYRRCRLALSADSRRFWDARPCALASGIGSSGRLERYFALFRRRVLPLIHSPATIRALLRPRDREDREAFYRRRWDTPAWRALFRAFFSRLIMGRLGRDPEMLRYARGSISALVLERTKRALTELEPAGNPYLHWMLTGTHGDALPMALRPESFDLIRDHLDRLEWRCESVQSFACRARGFGDRYNLSNIFEYLSPHEHRHLVDQLAETTRPGARLAYWNLFAPRCASQPALFRPLRELASRLHARDCGFFYSNFVLEEAA